LTACSNCGSANPAGAKFCSECGTPLSLACHDCGAPLAAGAKFCSECGASTGATAGAPPAADRTAASSTPPPVAERRLVSVLFVDLVGFTTLTEGVDAEETRELLSRYFDMARDVIERYGGTVEKFIGDAVMAVWGAPIARENDAERAVRAALDLVRSIPALRSGLEARAGVLTGEAAVTLGATNQGMVAGDLVNTASRLQTVAPPGTVLVGETTERAANMSITFEPIGDQQLKGKAAPVPAYRAVRVIAERGGRGRSDRLEAPFVGREDEFRLLKELVHATARERRPRIVSITGQAGVGKSRLAWELHKYLDGVVERVFWHSGRSPAYGEGITFWALGEMVRGRAGLAETDDEATTRHKVAETVAEWVPDDEERAWIESALLTLLGVETSSQMPRAELYSAWRTFFERIAASGTAILLFEDLHWADPGLLDFIDHLLDWTRNAPVIVITLARPDLLERRPEWGAGRRNFFSVGLEPLPEPAMRDLLAGLVPGLPEGGAHTIVTRADGIPLYAVETVRMLVADGLLVEGDGAYRPTGDLSTIAVPETLQALISARLDALEPVERSLMQDAAVLGQSFTPAGLAAVSGLDVRAVEGHLRTLVRRELLTHESDPRSPERGQYAFVQALIREVAYGTLAKRDRRSRHLAAARFFESLGEEELAGALAAHYLAAYRASSGDPEAQALAAQARIALKGAASRASSLGSHEQAVGYLLEAMEVTEDAAEATDLLERAGQSASEAGRSEVAESHLRAVIERRRELGDRQGEARAIGLLGQALVSGGRPEAAIEVLEPAAREFADLGDHSALAMIEHQLARGQWFVDQRDSAISLADRALGRAERLDDEALVADVLITKGSLVAQAGRANEGLALLRTGIDLAVANRLTAIHVRGLLNLSAAQIGRDLQAGFEAAREAMTLARRYGLRSRLATAAGNAFEAAVRAGEWDWVADNQAEVTGEELEAFDSFAVIRGPEEIAAFRGEPVEVALNRHGEFAAGAGRTQLSNWHGAMAAHEFAHGRYAEAVRHWEQSSELNVINAPYDLPRAARAAVWAGDNATADREASAFDALHVHGPASHATRVTLLAYAAAREGRRDEALQRFAEARSRWRELGVVLDDALIAMDMLMTLGPDEPAVAVAVAEARAIFTRLQARPFLDLIDRLAPAAESARARSAAPASGIAPSGVEQSGVATVPSAEDASS
jgi:class 3 adenylate cyclase/tetratricopeptide (TPR) repeat protein